MSEKFKILIIPKTNVTTEIAGNIIGLDFFLHTVLHTCITYITIQFYYPEAAHHRNWHIKHTPQKLVHTENHVKF